MSVSSTVSEINGDFRRKKNRKFSHPVYLMALLKGFFLEFDTDVMSQKTRMVGLPDG